MSAHFGGLKLEHIIQLQSKRLFDSLFKCDNSDDVVCMCSVANTQCFAPPAHYEHPHSRSLSPETFDCTSNDTEQKFTCS